MTPKQRAAAAQCVRTHPEVRRLRLLRWRQLASIMLAEIARTGSAIAAARDEVARSAGLPRARWALLEALARADHACDMTDLARRMRVSPPAVRRLAIALERKGLLEFSWSGEDRRSIHLLMTARARRPRRFGPGR